jgi:serine phosphatase RsbU (regulator of sigma subunit)
MLTDGIVEVANADDEDFGMERVERLLLEHSVGSLAEIATKIIEAMAKHGRQTDDQTLLLVRVLR